MARKDIDVRIRAKDEASVNAKKIAAALRLIGEDGKKASLGFAAVGNAQSRTLRDLNQAFTRAQQDVQRTATELRNAEEPTRKIEMAYAKAQARVSQFSKALDLQREAIRGASSAATNGFAAWARAYNPIVGSAERAAKAQDAAARAARRSALEAGNVAPAAERAARANRTLAADTNRASQSLLNFGHSTRTTLSFLQRMRGEVLALTASYIGFYAVFDRVRQAANAFRAVETAQQRLGVAFGGDTTKVTQEMAFLNAEADRLGYTFQTLANSYGKISVAAQSAGFSIADTRALFTSISEAARVNGASVDEMNGVLKAFEQMLSKGKIQAEELRGQLGDRMTGAFKLFADALGVTTQELDEMMKSGEVFADRNTLLKVAERLTAVYSGQLPKALASTGFAMDSFQRSAERANLLIAEGLVESIRDAAKAFSDFTKSAEGEAAFRGIGSALGGLIGLLAEIPKYFDLMTLAAKAFIAVKFGQWAGMLGASVKGLIEGMKGFNGSLALIGPRMVQLTRSEQALASAVLGANAAFASGRRWLAAFGAQTLVTRGIVGGLSATLGVLRGITLAVGASIRALMVALGGPIGLAITAVTTTIAFWPRETDLATAALRQHEKHLDAVRTAYQDAKGDVKDWAKEVRGVTELDLTQSAADLQESWAKAVEGIANRVREIQRVAQKTNLIGNNPEMAADLQKLSDLATALRDRKIGVDEFRQALDELAKRTKFDGVRDYAELLNRMANESSDGSRSLSELSDALAQNAAMLRKNRGEAQEGDDALLGLAASVDETNTAFDKSSLVETYTKAIEELKSKIPSLADDMDRLRKATEMTKIAWEGLTAAWKAGDLGKVLEISALWARGALENGMAAQDRRLDAYGAGNSDVINRIIFIEGGQGGGGPSTSSARGVGQFIDSTWLRYIDRLYPELQTLNETQKLALRSGEENRDIQMKVMEAFTRDNQAALLRSGLNAGPAETYLAHFLGAGDAIKVLLANPDELAANVVNAASVKANPSVFKDGMTIADLIAWSAGKMGDGSAVTATGQTEKEKAAADAAEAAAEAAADAADATRKRLADLEHQIRLQEMSNAGQEREAAILDAKRQALAENANLSAEELRLIEEKTGALWDQQNAQSGLELSEERVNQLYELRQQLLEQMRMAEENGDTGTAARLKTEIECVNVQLEAAIQKTIAMWQAVGGAEADAAIAKLQTMSMSIRGSKTQIGLFGLSMQTWQGVFDSMVQGIVGAFDSFAQAIANGENAFKAFGISVLQVLAQVLQQIAATIIQMQILKLLSGFGGSIGSFASTALSAMTGHTGGMVGSRAIGSGNRIGSGRPAWMSNALTYHTGGIAGFRPDEVSATLKKGEEVLTEEDPRHRANLGGSSPANSGGRLTQILAIGEKQIEEMVGRYGKKAVLTHIKSEAPTIRRMLGIA